MLRNIVNPQLNHVSVLNQNLTVSMYVHSYWDCRWLVLQCGSEISKSPWEQVGEAQSSEWLPVSATFWLYCAARLLHLSASYLGSSTCPDAAAPTEKRSASLWSIQNFWSRLCVSDETPINFPAACSLPPSQWLCSHLSLYSDAAELRDGRTQVSNSEMTLFWDSLREFRAAEQGEILIKIPSVIWEHSLWSREQSGKPFYHFQTGSAGYLPFDSFNL